MPPAPPGPPTIECLTLAPPWVDDLDRAVFGAPWGRGGEHERLWVIAPVAYARWSSLPGGDEAELLRVAVSPSARRRGLAVALLRRSERDLAAAGFDRLFLEVRSGNEAARRLYEREGWRVVGRRPAYYADGEEATLYGKELAAAPR